MLRSLFVLICSILLPLTELYATQLQCKVVGISDGDTLTCLYDYQQLKVRLQYIDAPESSQAFGKKSKQSLSQLAFNKTVILDITGYDRYKRLLAVIYDLSGQNINLIQVQQGMAWAYRQTQPIYQQAQTEAYQEKRGLWKDKNPINPAEWRAQKRKK